MLGSSPDTVPGYSPWPTARQNSPYLEVPGVQGLTEGIGGGQQFAYSPAQQFQGGAQQGTAPPSSIPNSGQMWNTFGGSGGSPSSFAMGSAPAIIQALMQAGSQVSP